MTGILCKADEMKILTPDSKADRLMAFLPYSYGRVVGVVHPIDIRSDVYHHRVVGSAIAEMLHGIAETAKKKWTRPDYLLVGRRIHQEMMTVE
jgi:hypothetical protein